MYRLNSSLFVCQLPYLTFVGPYFIFVLWVHSALLIPWGLQLTRNTLDCAGSIVGTLDRSLVNHLRNSISFMSFLEIFVLFNHAVHLLLPSQDVRTHRLIWKNHTQLWYVYRLVVIPLTLILYALSLWFLNHTLFTFINARVLCIECVVIYKSLGNSICPQIPLLLFVLPYVSPKAIICH